MKCFYCKAEMLEGKDKCDYCGKYQHEKTIDSEVLRNEEPKQKKKFDPKVIIKIIEFIIGLAIIVVAGYYVFKYFEKEKSYFGEWNCNNGDFTLKLDSKSFIMDHGSRGYEEANYIIEEEKENEDKSITILLDVSATKILINGGTQTNKSNTKFQLDLDDKSSTIMILKNLVKEEEYKCYKQ